MKPQAESKIYTQVEIDSNINILSNELEILKAERLEKSRQITHTKKQIELWEQLDKKQYKMF